MSPDPTPKYVTQAELQRLEDKIDSLVESMREMRPMLLAASGERAQIQQLRRDIDSSHDKHRIHFERYQSLSRQMRDQKEEILEQVSDVETQARREREEDRKTYMERFDRIERRSIQLGGILIGALAVLELLVPVLVPAMAEIVSSWGGGP